MFCFAAHEAMHSAKVYMNSRNPYFAKHALIGVGKLCSAWFEGWEFGVVDLKFVAHFKILRNVGTWNTLLCYLCKEKGASIYLHQNFQSNSLTFILSDHIYPQ